jgi:ketosteroid isomerase-like protein
MQDLDRVDEEQLRQRVDKFRDAYQRHDVESLVAMFAEDATYVGAPGVFHGRDAIRRFFSWDAELAAQSPHAVIEDVGVGILVRGSTVIWERVFHVTAVGVPYREESLAVMEFDDAGLIVRLRSYYDKLAVMDQIAHGLPGVSGWFYRRLVGLVIAAGSKGLPDPGPGRRTRAEREA